MLLVPTGKVLELFFLMFFNESLIRCEKIVSYLMQYSKIMGNYQKPTCSSSIAIERHNCKISAFLLNGYHTPQLKNIAIPAIAFSLHNFQGLLIPLNFFGGRNYVSILIAIVSNFTVLVLHNVICFRFMPLNHCVNQKAPQIHSVHLGLKPPLKHYFLCQAPSRICKMSKPPFLGHSRTVYWFFMHPLKIGFFSELP